MLFADMERGGDKAKAKIGYTKIQGACDKAAKDGFKYVWIDTCCIDRDSSAELSEAINSMYTWYRGSEKCYAYLADVPRDTVKSTFAASRWFQRGWTLQELIGPAELVFFSREWTEIGSKMTLQNLLTEITGIDAGILTDPIKLKSTSIGKRMSWASHRNTTRTEDIAYCLMGIFDVNMPMLYGEGEKAFIRLQEEIMKHSNDQSLFAWIDPTAPADSRHGLLAKSPANFKNSGNMMRYHDSGAPFSISNKGLCIELPLLPCEKDLYVAALGCLSPPEYEGFLGIYLTRVSTGNDQYARVKAQDLCRITALGNTETFYVRQTILSRGGQDIYPLHSFQLRRGPSRDDGYKLIKTMSASSKKAPPAILTSRM